METPGAVMQTLGIIVFSVVLIAGAWMLTWLSAMVIAGQPVRQTIAINWHASVLRHVQIPDQLPPPCTLTCSCGRTWEVAK